MLLDVVTRATPGPPAPDEPELPVEPELPETGELDSPEDVVVVGPLDDEVVVVVVLVVLRPDRSSSWRLDRSSPITPPTGAG